MPPPPGPPLDRADPAVRRAVRRGPRRRRSSTSRCHRSSATCTSARTTCSGSSTPTCSCSAASCCSAAARPTCSGRRRVFIFGLVALLARLAGGRPLRQPGRADRRPRRAGPRRRDPLPRRAVDRHHDVRRGRRPQQGARRVGRGRRLRRRRGRAARWHPHRRARLAVGAVRQRADRPGRRGDRARPCWPRAGARATSATSTSPARSPAPPASSCSSTPWSRRSTTAGARRRRSGCWPCRSRSSRPSPSSRPGRGSRSCRSGCSASARSPARTSPASLTGAALFSMFFFISLYMQQILGFDALEAGLAYLPLAVSIIVAAGVASQLVTRLGARPVLVVGLVLVVAGPGLVLAGLGRRHATSPTCSSRRCWPAGVWASPSSR